MDLDDDDCTGKLDHDFFGGGGRRGGNGEGKCRCFPGLERCACEKKIFQLQ